MAPWHGSLQQPEGPPDSPVTSSALSRSRQGECSRPRISRRKKGMEGKRSPMQKELEECFPKSLPAAQSTVTLVRYVRRRVHCANEEDAVPPRV